MFWDSSTKKRLKKLIFISIILFCILVGVYYYSDKVNIQIPCPINRTFGVYCAGCGMTRATVSLLKLDFYQAIRYNAFSIIVVPVIIFFILGEIYAWLLNRQSIFIKAFYRIFLFVILSGMFIYGVIRNFSAFSYLIPTKLI